MLVELFFNSVFIFSLAATGIYLLTMGLYIVSEKRKSNKTKEPMDVDWSVVVIHTSLILVYYISVGAAFIFMV